MISSDEYKKIRIHITTYKNKQQEKVKKLNEIMNENRMHEKRKNAKFICSICLNTKQAAQNAQLKCNRRKTRSCPLCKTHCEVCTNNSNENLIAKEKSRNNMPQKEKSGVDVAYKGGQTPQKDVNQGLNLLNEVLTVFQSKKNIEIPKHKNGKTVICKDACVSTDLSLCKDDSRRRLSISKVFQCAIESDHKIDANGKFTMVNAYQPRNTKQSQIDLIHRKSSSIPQMKLDEIKKSIKEKEKPRSAVEEVNRMFATVRKNCDEVVNDKNRPAVRNGPRVLPVARPKTFESCNQNHAFSDGTECSDGRCLKSYKCHDSEDFMSSGDTSAKYECCHHCELERCDKCVYMMCCHYKTRHQMQAGVLIRERCRNSKGEFLCKHKFNNNDLDD